MTRAQRAAEGLCEEQRRFGAELWRFAEQRWPAFPEQAQDSFGRNYFRVAGDEELATAWALFHDRDRGRTALEEFLATRDEALSPSRFALVSAELAAWISYWEVREVTARKGLHLRDLLTGEEAWVWDERGQQTLRRGAVICGRVLSLPQVALFGGVFPTALPGNSSVVRGLVSIAQELYANAAQRIRPSALRAGDEPLALINCWRMASGLLRPEHTGSYPPVAEILREARRSAR